MPHSSIPRRAAVLAVCLGATAAVGSAPALAATVPGENLFGTGSSLQNVAQTQVWTGTWFSTPADHSTLSNNPTATYTATGSGSGLAEFGNTTGALDLTKDPTADAGSTNGYGVPVLDGYVGTDDPPTGPLGTAGTNLTFASAAATGSATTAIHELTTPVAQSPLAMIFSLPTGITAGTGSQIKITNALLQSVWDANVPASAPYAANTWGSFLKDIGWKLVSSAPKGNQFTDAGGSTGGDQSITLMVRANGSGTTYTMRGFLNLSGDLNYPLSTVNDGTTWPVATVSSGPNGPNTTNGIMTANTTATPGAVSYPGLSDAATATEPYKNKVTTSTTGGTHQFVYALVQDNQGGTGTVYSDPQGTVAGSTNVYTGNNININGGNASFVGHWTVPFIGATFDATGSWGGTQASDPNVFTHGGGRTAYYPIAAVTYDLAWSDYDEAGSNLVGNYGGTTAQATAAGNTAKSLVTYIVKQGQTDLANAHKYYAKLPSKIDNYAITAAGKITP